MNGETDRPGKQELRQIGNYTIAKNGSASAFFCLIAVIANVQCAKTFVNIIAAITVKLTASAKIWRTKQPRFCEALRSVSSITEKEAHGKMKAMVTALGDRAMVTGHEF